jgi:Zn-finger nucleic acid-binding protein
MKCVKCNGALQKANIGGVEVDQCGKCSGIWFDIGELEKVLASQDVQDLKAAVDSGKAQDEQRAACPVCGGAGKMVQVVSRNHDVHIDTCSVCYGQWLDGGEFEKLQRKGLFENVSAFFRRMV